MEKEIVKMQREMVYIPMRGRYCDIVQMNLDWFDYRNDEPELPNVGAFCKKCARESAYPIYPIKMNGNSAYALKCKKCGSEYPMYKSMFIQRYIGYDLLSGGRVNPTHGTKSIVASMDRKAKEYYNDRRKRIDDKMCKIMNCSHEEYQEKKKRWEEENKIWKRKFEKEQADRHAKWEDEERKEKSKKQKVLIDKGIIKYVKNIGLVNTETGEVIKL